MAFYWTKYSNWHKIRQLLEEARMRVIITGGSGLIGRALAGDLVGRGHEVIVLSRDPLRHGKTLPPGIRLEAWDGATARGWGDLVEETGAIVNLAGENLSGGRWTTVRKQALLESRLNPGRAISEAVAQATRKPGVVIQASAVGYYGIHQDEVITEQAAQGKDYLADLVGKWEASTSAVEQYGVRRVITRSGVVFSMQGVTLPRLVLPFRFFVGGRLGSGRQWLSWIHIEDEIAGIRYLIEHPDASGVFNLTSPNPLTNSSLAQILGRVMKRPSIMPVPAFALRVLFGEMAMIVLDGQRVIPERLLKHGFVFRYAETEAALKALLR
jgi:uncharacterized protein (TIGR01777 family)